MFHASPRIPKHAKCPNPGVEHGVRSPAKAAANSPLLWTGPPHALGLPGGHGDRVVTISIANLLWSRAMGFRAVTLSGRMDRNLEDHQLSMLAPFDRHK